MNLEGIAGGMKILVLNAGNTLNYGSMMMIENLVYHTLRHSDGLDIEFVVPSERPMETQDRLSKSLGKWAQNTRAVAVPELAGAARNRIGRGLQLFLGLPSGAPLHELARRCDLVVVLGGDDYTEDYGYRAPLLMLAQLRALVNLGLPVLMLGQSIGPFYSWRVHVARTLLKRMSKIVAREPLTAKYLQSELKLRNVGLASDLALLPLCAEEQQWRAGVTVDGSYVTVVPSELIWRYSPEPIREAYIQQMAAACKTILERLPDHKLVILPHVLAPESSDDRKAARDIATVLKENARYSRRIVVIEQPLLPYEARTIVGRSRFVVTGRMHAAISAVACGVPPLSMAYSRKYWGIIGEQLGLSDWIVDIRFHSWEETMISLTKRMEVLLENLTDILAHIEMRLDGLRALAMENIRELCTCMELARKR